MTAVLPNTDPLSGWGHSPAPVRRVSVQAGADFNGWEASCARWAVTWTQEHHIFPLWPVEAACIGRSVARWTWKRFSAEAFSCAPGGARTQGWGQAEARVDPMQRFHGRNERAGTAVDC